MRETTLPLNELERLAVLHRLGLLDTPGDESFDRITRMAQRLFDVPVASISLVDADRQWFKSAVGTELRETPRAISFCTHAIQRPGAMVVPNLPDDARFCDNPLVTGEQALRFYAGYPLTVAGQVVGTLCLLDQRPREFSKQQIEHLADLAAWTELAIQRDAEARFQGLLDGVSEAIFTFDEAGNISYFNAPAERIFGYDATEMVGRNLLTLLPEAQEGDRQALLFDGQLELAGRRKDGTAVCLELSVSEADLGGQVLFIGVARDVTAARQMAAELRERELQLDVLFDTCFDGVLVHHEGQVLVANASAERFFGCAPGGLVGRHLSSLISKESQAVLQQAIEQGKHDSHLVVGPVVVGSTRPDGSRLHAEIVGKGYVHDGRDVRVVAFRDVTARMEAEAALRDRERRFRLLAENSRDIIFRFNHEPSPGFEYVSPAVTAILGVTPEACYADPLVGTRLGVKLTEDKGSTRNYTFWRPEGSPLHLEITSVPQYDEAGTLVAVEGIARDVTDRQVAEMALRVSEAKLRAIVEHTTDIIYIKDLQGRYVMMNPAGALAMGLSSDAVSGKRIDDFLAEHQAQAFNDGDRRVLENGTTETLESEMVTREGERVTYWLTKFPYRLPGGAIAGVVGISRDITERKRDEAALRESELRFRSVVQAAGEAIVLVDGLGRIALWNPAARELFGYEEGEALGLDFRQLLSEGDREAYTRAIASTPPRPDRRSAARPLELVGLRVDGTAVAIEIAIGAWDAGEGRYFAQAIRDITERRELDRMKEEFVSTVSHELRTPLNMVCGSLDLLASGMVAPDRVQRIMEIAATNTDRLIRIINDILDIQSIGWGKLSVVKKPIDLAPAIANATESMRPMLENAGLRLVYDCQPARVLADGDRLVQALTNLVGNAAKFARPGTAVSVSLRTVGNEAHLLVCDRGRGIPADKLEAIFERFAQIEPEDATLKRGAGLGLAICRAIAQAHGGRIWAESQPGEGTIFTLALPLERVAGLSRDPAV